MTVATNPTRKEYESYTFSAPSVKAPSRQDYEQSVQVSHGPGDKFLSTVIAEQPPQRQDSSIYGAFDVWASPPGSEIWKSPGAEFTGEFGAGWMEQTRVPALAGKRFAPPKTTAGKIGRAGGRMSEAVTELIGLGAALRGVGITTQGLLKGATGLEAAGIKAAETGGLFVAHTLTDEARKRTAEAIYDEDFGSRGGEVFLESFAMGAILSFASSGIGATWAKLKPTEQSRALKLLGLKKGASLREINRAARIQARKFHPDKVKGMRDSFDKVIKARDTLRKMHPEKIIKESGKRNFVKNIQNQMGVSRGVAENALKRLQAGQSIQKVDQMLSQAKFGIKPLVTAPPKEIPESAIRPARIEYEKPITAKEGEIVAKPAEKGKVELVLSGKEGDIVIDAKSDLGMGKRTRAGSLSKVEQYSKKALGLPTARNVGAFLKRFALTVPEFTQDPVFTIDKEGFMVYQDGGKFRFKPELFGIEQKLETGQKIRLDLESYGIKVAGGKRLAKAKEFTETLKPPTQAKAEATKMKGRPGKLDVSELAKVHKTFMNIVEPSKAVEISVGKEPYAAVIKGIHQADVGRIEFNETQIEGQDKSLNQMSQWFNKFSDKDLKNFMTSRGSPRTPEAQRIQQKAMSELPKELRKGNLFNAVQRIADSNYKYLQSVVGDDINRVEDYFYGIYKNPKKVEKFLDYWKTTKRFTKEKKLPTVADALNYGLELKNWNPIENLKSEYVAISHLEGMNWMKDELLRTGKGKFIDDMLEAPLEWDKVNDPVFKGLRMHPDLAKMINNLISTNKISRVPALNALREINNLARTVKFVGSAFHLLSVAKQSVADSGYLGFLYKLTATRGFTRGFKQNDPIFRTTAYKDYVKHGGGHRYSVESEARRALTRQVDKLNRNMGVAVKVGALPLKIPTGFVNWMFQSYIPKVKYSKFLDVVAEKEKKFGRKLTSPEKIDIIKEQQNFYGMMNERLFGRSGTVTSAMRFYFMSPGYAEGNYRTMLKAATQWSGKTGHKANRSRSNIINSWILSAAAATAATLAFTGKAPDKPETLDDARDLFKIDTGKVDEKGRKIMIDMMTYDKDYWNVAFNMLRLRPDVAIGKSWKRIGGMKAPTADMIVDLALMSMGKAIYDWKGDRVVEITDPFLKKVMKLTTFEVKKLSPISVSVFQQSRKRDIDTTVAAVETLLGFRPTKSEKDIREQKLISKMWSLAGQREELSYVIGQSTDPKKTVANYNKVVNNILESPYIPKPMKDEWGKKLLVDYDKVVAWKRFPAGKMTKAEMQRAYDAHTLSVPYKRRGEPVRLVGAPRKGSEQRVKELQAEAKKRGFELRRGPRTKGRDKW